MANTLKGWLADNTVTADPNDKILVLESTGKADINKVYEEMLNEDTGLRIETIVHVTTLYERICARLLMNGWQLNTGLFYAVPRFTGVVESGKWNPEKNSIYVAFNQDKVIREEIAKTIVHILGEKADVMYILEVEDRKTGLKDGTVTPGRNLFVRGANLKVIGDKAVSVPLRGYRIPNNCKPIFLCHFFYVFPSPYGAIEFQIKSGKSLLQSPLYSFRPLTGL